MNKIIISNPNCHITQKNYIELVGVVGAVRKTELSDVTIIRFNVATTRMFKSADGTATLETQWSNVRYFADKKENMYDIQKGDKVMVKGHLTNNAYTNADGRDYTVTEIVANTLTLIETSEPLMAEA